MRAPVAGLLALGLGALAPAAAAAPPASPTGRVAAAGEVAPGARLRATVSGLVAPARLQVREAGRWRSRARPLPGKGVRVLRAPDRPRRWAVRGLGADGAVTPARRVRVRYLRLAAVGDVNLGDGPGAQIGLRGPAFPWTSVGGVLRRADLAFANLECAVSRRGRPVPKTYTFRGSPTSLSAMARRGGIDVVDLANNHSLDYGRAAFRDELRSLRGRGLVGVGGGRDAAAAYRPRIVRRLGLRVAFVAFSVILPYDFRAAGSRSGTAWGDPHAVRRAVRRAGRNSDVVVAAFHWGIERHTRESAEQRALAGVALRAGADAVIGAHPHVLQPIRRPAGHVVAYSLGNFVFSAGSPGTQRTGILETDLAAHRVAASRLRRATIVNTRPVLAR